MEIVTIKLNGTFTDFVVDVIGYFCRIPCLTQSIFRSRPFVYHLRTEYTQACGTGCLVLRTKPHYPTGMDEEGPVCCRKFFTGSWNCYVYDVKLSLFIWITAGCWSEEVQQQLLHYLLDASRDVKSDLIHTMLRRQIVVKADKAIKLIILISFMLDLLMVFFMNTISY